MGLNLSTRRLVCRFSSSPFAAEARGIGTPASAGNNDGSSQTISTRRRGRLPTSRDRGFFAALFLLPSLAACGGVGQSTPGALPQGAGAPLAADAAAREAQSDSAIFPATPLVAGPEDLLYVANAGNNSITVYHTDASGNTAPLATIKGSRTELNDPRQLSEDSSGDLYVADTGASSILVFAHGANGNVAPLRVIAGPLTGLSTTTLTALIVDQATGKIFAIAEIAGGVSELLRFAPNASGNEAPIATSARDLSGALQIAFDSTGNNIIEASNGHCCNLSDFGVYTYGKQFPNGATPSAPYAITNFEPPGIADDPATKTYLVSGDDGVAKGIFRFDEDTVGSGAFNGGKRHYTPAVVSVITSDTCGGQLALGYQRNIYVAHNTVFPQCAADAVYVYQHDASGNAAPLRVLMGSATKLDQPAGIYEGK